MIELREMELSSFLYTAIEKMKTPKQLISWTKQINPLNLLYVFERLKATNQDRIYWSNSNNDFTLVGLGSVKKLIANEDRFQQLQKQWTTLLDEVFIHNPFPEAGTGLAAIGGMAFDPKRPKSERWEKYPTGQLTIPEYVIIYNKGNYFLTVNRYIQKNDSVEKVIQQIGKMENLILHSTDKQKQERLKVIAKEEIEPKKWKQSVQKAVDEIKRGRAKKIVLARELRLQLNRDADIASMLKKLRETQPNSYIFAFEHGDNCFLGATPERLVYVEGDKLLSTCLAGTAPRGKTITEDEQIANTLLNDQKNREEHEYVVQMIKEGIENYCEDIHIPKEPVIHPLRDLQHLYTPVTAKIKKPFSIFDIVEKLHPTPALGGVPKEKALAFIREQELLDRGWYGAPIGWLDSHHNGEFAVAIRSGLVQKNEVSLFAGCGVMRDSDAEMEYEETNVKFLPMLTILEDHDESY
ncbi:MAG TPA: isochorismate synthase [Pseudogracilibacillus sp.]|nr:isochorismate synthase [Pseudogracilibacillus sp.]